MGRRSRIRTISTSSFRRDALVLKQVTQADAPDGEGLGREIEAWPAARKSAPEQIRASCLRPVRNAATRLHRSVSGRNPLPRRTLLALKVSSCTFGPKCSRLHFYQTPLRIEADDLVEPRHIDPARLSIPTLGGAIRAVPCLERNANPS
jgi:hypothetical protein